ncbi:MAG: hypothetical protein Q8Q09_12270 [Deltaproteobacteria bacterium]|nr:hypothetical protein [Deltaproteobacteria bacterium]
MLRLLLSRCVLVLCSAVALWPRAAIAQPAVTETARPALAPSHRVLDEVVASIEIAGDDGPPIVVFASELRLAVRTLLVTSRAPEPLTIDVHESVSSSVLNDLLGEKLLEREGRRSDDAEPPPQDFAEAIARLRTSLGEITVEALQTGTGAVTRTLNASIRRRLCVALYLRRHQARLLEPSDTELREAFDSGRFSPYRNGQSEFARVRAEIRERLAAIAMPRAVRAILRAMGAQVRIRRWPLEV